MVKHLSTMRETWVRSLGWEDSLEKWQPTPVLLPRKSHGRRSLVQATAHGVAKSQTRLSDFTFTFTFPGSSAGQESASNAGSPLWIPGLGRSPGEGNGNPLQYYCLENPVDRGAWWATVFGVAKSRTRLSDFTIIPSR